MAAHAMTVAEYKTVKQRDFENGAVRDEIRQALIERERFRAALEILSQENCTSCSELARKALAGEQR